MNPPSVPAPQCCPRQLLHYRRWTLLKENPAQNHQKRFLQVNINSLHSCLSVSNLEKVFSCSHPRVFFTQHGRSFQAGPGHVHRHGKVSPGRPHRVISPRGHPGAVHWSRHLQHPRHILGDIMLGRRNWGAECIVQQFHGRIESMSGGSRCCWPSKGTTTLALTP